MVREMGWIAFVTTIVLAGCSADAALSRSPTASVRATTSTRPTATADPKPQSQTARPLRDVALSGTGDKSGRAVLLWGQYTITSKVTAQPGCSWTLSVKPGTDDVVSISTDAAGSQEQTLPISLNLGRYRIVVTSSNCGNWSVSLTRS